MELDWKDMDMPESREPTEPRRANFSEASVKSKRELLIADLRMTTALPVPFEVDPVTPEEERIKMSELVQVADDSVSLMPLSRLSAIDSLCFSSSDSSLSASISSISAIDSLRSSTNLERSCSFRALRVKMILRSHFCASWIP